MMQLVYRVGESVSEGGVCITGARLLRWPPDRDGPRKRITMVPVVRLPFVDPSIQQTFVKPKLCTIVQNIKESKVKTTVSALKELNRFVK